ncbi:hypothetical protein A3740_01045 [Oleiphilus sp. HI0068]|nr:hypothetical protein A3740_01045 [Oleiphilus sp. HI0068]KZY79773.1 hypothetical protein A3741_06405 [Oleiphilus sp. HI0069]KZZ39823.1 hypothetical protein A3755_04475 [Oleiphilus sp. HI0085]
MADFPNLWIDARNYSLESNRYNLQRWLYDSIPVADIRRDDFKQRLDTGFYGEIKTDRITLVLKLKEYIEDQCASGKSVLTINTIISQLSTFFGWVSSNSPIGKTISLNTAEDHYYEYAEYLYEKAENKSLTPRSAQDMCINIGASLSFALEKSRSNVLFNRTRINKKTRGSRKYSTDKSDKQDLNKAFLYCEWLHKVATSITINDMYGQLPIRIDVNESYLPVDIIEIYSGQKPKSEYTKQHHLSCKQNAVKPGQQFDPISLNSNLNWDRKKLVNYIVVVQSQFFIAAAQTPNPSVVYELVGSPKKFIDNGDTFLIKGFKGRKGGEYHCEIFKDYKKDLKQYLAFKNHFFPETDLLFPIFKRIPGEIGMVKVGLYKNVKNRVAKSGVEFITPRKLRSTYSNWLKRRSGDEDYTADVMNHSVQTFRQDYNKPNQQKAITEVTRFWNENDFLGSKKTSIIASDCNGTPESVKDIPQNLVKPNCVNPSGCLWCKNHRDIDSFDYVWSLCSFRKLKTLEILISRTEDICSALDLTIERVTQKISWFREKSQTKKLWVDDSEQRMEEGDYHPNFTNIIEILER